MMWYVASSVPPPFGQHSTRGSGQKVAESRFVWGCEAVSYEAGTLIEPAWHPVLFAKEQISVDEVPAQDGPAVRGAEELLIIVEDEIGHEILLKLEHELEVLLAAAPPTLPVRLLPPHGHRKGIQEGGQYNQVDNSSLAEEVQG
jgi:hypothetical protein